MPAERPTAPERLYTWLDVDDHLASLAANQMWPEWLLEADAFWDSLELRVRSDTPPEDVFDWLEQSFGFSSVDRDGRCIILDDVPAAAERHRRTLDVAVVPMETEPAVRRIPRLREQRIVRDLAKPLPRPASATFPGDVQIAAFHSFKGGVGRTLHALALAEELVQQHGARVLLVDADLEAPGITWMLEAQGRRADFAYDDFLALLHGSEDGDFHEAIRIGSAYLPNQTFGSIIVLPATRRTALPLPPRIQPSDLLTPDRPPYVLTEALAALAAEVGAAVVIVDLRAGSSELSAPILLDPRVQRVFVTTLSDQSLRGTERLIREVGRRAPTARESDPPAAAVITQFRELDHDEQMVRAAGLLRDAIESTLGWAGQENNHEDKVVDTDVVAKPLTSRFIPGLLALPAKWEEVLALVRDQRLPKVMEPLADALHMPAETAMPDTATAPAHTDLGERRRRLAEKAGKLVYAETTDITDFLVTDSLRNLLAAHRTEPPIGVVVGAKGSGKTFTFVQMARHRTWQAFAQAAGVKDVTLTAPVVPVLTSRNLDLPKETAEALAQGAKEFGGVPASQVEIRDLISNQLEHGNQSDPAWRLCWLICLARAIGIDAGPDDVERRLVQAAHRQIVFVIDGLEDLFQDFSRNEAQQQALRVLLTDCLDWLRGLRGRPFGLVVFVRQDLVQGAIRQNSRQFLARYQDYALRWNTDEALRLALWVCQRAGALLNVDQPAANASESELPQLLLPVWGEKMGGPKSREARSTQWFLAALSDFNQQIQARDIVSFLHEAAELSIEDTRWHDRLLAPTAMRKALVRCSHEKIEAIRAENPLAGNLLMKLRRLVESQKQVPFKASSVGLSPEDLEILDNNGVVFREDDQYWIPEIFRHGLGFRAMRRPRILAVANLVRRRNNLD